MHFEWIKDFQSTLFTLDYSRTPYLVSDLYIMCLQKDLFIVAILEISSRIQMCVKFLFHLFVHVPGEHLNAHKNIKLVCLPKPHIPVDDPSHTGQDEARTVFIQLAPASGY